VRNLVNEEALVHRGLLPPPQKKKYIYHLYGRYNVKLYVVIITFYEVKGIGKETAVTRLAVPSGYFSR
jgi:hypothetical protein